jgi:hypothetical protein
MNANNTPHILSPLRNEPFHSFGTSRHNYPTKDAFYHLIELGVRAGPSTARITDITSIIEKHIDWLDVSTSPIADWTQRLQHFRRLKK